LFEETMTVPEFADNGLNITTKRGLTFKQTSSDTQRERQTFEIANESYGLEWVLFHHGWRETSQQLHSSILVQNAKK
jgi:hypothetical protein